MKQESTTIEGFNYKPLDHRFTPGQRVWVIGEVTEGKVPMELFILTIIYSCIPENYIEYEIGRKDPSSKTGFRCQVTMEDTERKKAPIFTTKQEALVFITDEGKEAN